MTYPIFPLGDSALLIEVGKIINANSQQAVRNIDALLESEPPVWLVETIPAFTTVTLIYDPLLITFNEAKVEIAKLLKDLAAVSIPPPRTVEIPVCYGGNYGPDLEFVAKHNGLSPEEVIAIHTGGSYTVHMIGFAPGFPYLGGMAESIAAPRKETPRLSIPARSVGIAGDQTGIYPISTPGGWQLIGRTPFRLFLPENDIPSLLRAGDSITFRQISEDDYRAMEEGKNADDT
ncbi:5-oxoprolinase subunit PxpB [Planococcus sp. X10-3]|uniref:5-oxoprolinase subunit PxpB n=1 Tax=Planococcus sp. X10-3 TaxID=3061240 RepID=UPI003BB19F61